MVDLPHCWNTRDTFQPGVDYFRGTGAYLRSFRMPSEETHLVAGGFYGLADVFLDRRRIARVDGQYLGFGIDLSPHATPGREHELVVRLTNRCPKSVLPGTPLPDFLLFGGLAGGLRLEARPTERLAEDGIEIRTDHLLSPVAKVGVEVPVVGSPGAELRVAMRLTDPAGETVHEEGPISVDSAGRVRADFEVERPRLWSPEAPCRYLLEIELRKGSEVRDRCRLQIGLREAEFSAEGLRLNGEPLELQGFNRHESIPGLGSALPDWMHRTDAQLLKDYGANLVRLSHYPQSPAFLEACDELGLFVYAEVASWKTARGGAWRRAALRQLEALIRRDRHRPSVLFWGMANEARHRRTFVDMAKLIHELDPGRPATYAESRFYRGRRANIPGIPDVWSCNYDVPSLDEQHRASRSGAVLVSECCNDQAVRGDLDEEILQAERVIDLWDRIEDKPYLVGYVLWSLSDYATLHRRRYTRFTGKFDAWRQPKLAAALFRARHSPQPVLELFGSWAREGSEQRRIAVVTNCSHLEMVLPEGRRPLPYEGLLTVHELRFQPAPLHIDGRHDRGRATAIVQPWGRAERLELTAERRRVAWDWTGFGVRVVDRDGVPVGDFNGRAEVNAVGHAVLGMYLPRGGVDLTRGAGRFFVRSKRRPGQVTLAADSQGLEGARLTVELDDQAPGELGRAGSGTDSNGDSP